MAELLRGAPVAAAIDERSVADVEELKRDDDLSYERGAKKR